MKGSREVTIYDVAKDLNLSPSTVSRGLKNHPHIRKATREEIQSVANEMGYRQNKFASNLRQKHTNTIGIVVPRLKSYFMATAIAGFNNEPVSQVVQPNLTTVDYPALEIGEMAETSLINNLKDSMKSDLSSIVLNHKLTVRGSSLRQNYNQSRKAH